MNLDGSRVVVTGAARGIGAALATRFASHGAQVVVNDIDEGPLGDVAEAIGGYAVVADTSQPSGAADLVHQAREQLDGEIDLYVANAGIAVGGDEQTDPADWQRSWEVNVMTHVYAAQVLVPAWLARGNGHLVTTASAAGLLTMLGSASYSVTKHAAESFAEWMRASYGHRGITVQCLCPLGVNTRMVQDSGPMGELLLKPGAVEVEVVCDTVMDALDDGRFLILPHPEVAEMYVHRAQDPDRWLRGMNRLQQHVQDALGTGGTMAR